MAAKGYTGRGGPIDRPLRYPVGLVVKISKDAKKTLEEMAAAKNTTVATLGRRAIMKDIYIYKAEKKRHEEIEKELGPNELERAFKEGKNGGTND